MHSNSCLKQIANLAFRLIVLCPLLFFCQTTFADTQQKEDQKIIKNTDKAKNIAVSYENSKKYSSIERQLKKSQILEEIFGTVQEFMVLPSNLTAEYKSCGDVNAFYDPETKKIIICYEIVKWLQGMAKKQETKSEDKKAFFENVFTFFVLHELGHALIDLYDLPITGREEDVADQISAYMLMQDGKQAIIDTGASFYSDLKGMSAEKLPFDDGHSLDRQRYYNLLCWVYGSDEEEFAFLIKDGYLGQDRAGYCPGEYYKLTQGVNQLLDRYIKPDPENDKPVPN